MSHKSLQSQRDFGRAAKSPLRTAVHNSQKKWKKKKKKERVIIESQNT